MSRRVVISQPLYFPWAGFIDQISRADVLIWLDDAQFSKGSFVNRNRIVSGEALRWLTIPLAGSGTFQRICDLKPRNPSWREDHRRILRESYADAPHFQAAESLLGEATAMPSVSEVAAASCLGLLERIGSKPREVYRSSEMGIAGSGSKRVLDLVLTVDGSEYITGHGAANYLDHESFEEAGVSVAYMEYRFSPWRPRPLDSVFGVSFLDLLALKGIQDFQRHIASRLLNWRAFLAQ